MLWLALLGKLNTKDMLVKKGILMNSDNVCSFCTQQPEALDHLLVSCQSSWCIWCLIAEDFGVQLREQQRQQNLRQLYEWWMSQYFHNRTHKKLFMLAFFAVVWSLWMKRNKIVFEQQELHINAMHLKIKWRIVWWAKAWKETRPYNAEQLIGNFQVLQMLG
uniref:Reverse transcriptase zinc-binding domain-containing protein n=1 Tax=Opuntia streptacantha TaxID=393608 RepID=A0A7C8YG96_OPUST